MTKAEFNKYIKKIRLGDANGLKRIYDEYYAKITYTAVLVVKDYHIAQDIASEVMLYILQNAADIGPVEYPDAWIRTIAKNRAVDFVRKDSRIVLTDGELIGHVADGFPSDVYYEMVDSIGGLTKAEQDLVELHYVYGYKYQEIAEIINAPIGTIKRQIHNIKNKLIHLKKNL